MDVREKLVELITDKENDLVRKIAWLSDSCRIKEVANHLIANGVTVQEWYSADDPPKEDGTYIVQTETGAVCTARYYAPMTIPAKSWRPYESKRDGMWQSNRKVVKWMPMPEPPKEG